MKKICFLLSLAGHALVIIFALNAEFPIVVAPRPPKVIAIEVAAPPLLNFATGTPTEPLWNHHPQLAVQSGGSGNAMGAAPAGAIAGPAVKGVNGLPFPAQAEFNLKQATPGEFTLAPASRGPRQPVGFKGPNGSPRLGKYSAAAYNPGVAMAGTAVQGRVAFVQFNIREKTIAAWTEAILARIERNWIIPPMARLAFSGQVQITLTIEKDGRQQALVIDDTSLPESLAQSALQAVNASLPLPPLPENVAGQTFAFTFIFIYNG
ncbi:MAG: TonB C-terminal domain-containing protein [Candidatus Aminicenantes bacterium]|nr:TonB C-terminal domain-containing protein [Acidobacteriota bacterium]MCG2811922.1 TonB C-terminal domain-containing protein [Candidatus Aminicenantes bacterium]